MASTDSSFVGHIHDDQNSPETYLAAAVLSDMVVNLCITPPLAFNQVLNGLVGQAMGSNNRPMAGIWLQQSMFWLTVTMLPCLVGLWFVQPILELLGFPTEIAKVAGVYAKYNCLWPVPNGLYQVSSLVKLKSENYSRSSSLILSSHFKILFFRTVRISACASTFKHAVCRDQPCTTTSHF